MRSSAGASDKYPYEGRVRSIYRLGRASPLVLRLQRTATGLSRDITTFLMAAAGFKSSDNCSG